MSGMVEQRQQAFVYRGCFRLEQLQALLEKLNPHVYLTWDLAHCDFSRELRENGTAFNDQLEIRWCHTGDYIAVLLLSD
ncbi:MAG: hypothetical protein RMJ19_04705, partial [Gemmatales bacterium]|nr:hypothetical protein [Gemmatales bacterium]MDW8174950.1 hypothetical protein [Gemmatales bacterium]